MWDVSRQAVRDADARERLRIAPRHVNDEIDGFVLQELDDAPTLLALGFAPGDVIRSVNGRRLDSPETVLALRTELLDRVAPFDVTVEIDRGGGDTVERVIHIS